ncbi:MAG TPA: hypothetical protein VLV76_09950 [Candidatus Acidoferrum sp.]|nr:hypothetical protein [Candidatus Acidoferrum sp.]
MSLAALILRRIAFVDRVVVWVARPLSIGTQAFLRHQCELAFPDRKHRPPKGYGFAETWVIIRPSRDALRALHRLLGPDGCLIVACELSLDLIVANGEIRSRLALLMSVCWAHLRAPRNSAPSSGGAVEYSAPRFRNAEAVTADGEVVTVKRPTRRRQSRYSDERSRATGHRYCVHLEVKFQSARACRDAGVGSLIDIVRLDHAAFWRRHLTLRYADPAALGRITGGTPTGRGRPRSGSTQAQETDGRRLMGIVPVLVGSDHYTAPSGNVDAIKSYLRTSYPGVRSYRAFVTIPNDRFVPTKAWNFRYDHD